MKKFIKHHNAASPVTAGNIALADIPRGVTLHQTILECKSSGGVLLTVAQMKAEIDYITLQIGSREVYNQISATDLLEMEAYLGNSNKDGYITLYHALPHLDKYARIAGNNIDKEITSIGTTNAEKITVKIKLNGTAPTVGGGTINVKGLVSEDARKMGSFLVWQKHNREFSNTGKQELSDLPKGDANRAYVFLKFSKDTLSEVNLKVNNRDWLEDVSKELHQHQNVNAGRTLVTNKFHIDFTLENALRIRDLLPQGGVNELRADLTWSTPPNSYEILAVTLEDLNQQ